MWMSPALSPAHTLVSALSIAMLVTGVVRDTESSMSPAQNILQPSISRKKSKNFGVIPIRALNSTNLQGLSTVLKATTNISKVDRDLRELVDFVTFAHLSSWSIS